MSKATSYSASGKGGTTITLKIKVKHILQHILVLHLDNLELKTKYQHCYVLSSDHLKLELRVCPGKVPYSQLWNVLPLMVVFLLAASLLREGLDHSLASRLKWGWQHPV